MNKIISRRNKQSGDVPGHGTGLRLNASKPGSSPAPAPCGRWSPARWQRPARRTPVPLWPKGSPCCCLPGGRAPPHCLGRYQGAHPDGVVSSSPVFGWAGLSPGFAIASQRGWIQPPTCFTIALSHTGVKAATWPPSQISPGISTAWREGAGRTRGRRGSGRSTLSPPTTKLLSSSPRGPDTSPPSLARRHPAVLGQGTKGRGLK